MSCAPNLSRCLHFLNTTLKFRCETLKVGIIHGGTGLFVGLILCFLLDRDDIRCRSRE